MERRYPALFTLMLGTMKSILTSAKCWLVTAEDLGGMYANMKSSLWCDADTQGDKKVERKGRKRNVGTSSKLEEDDVDEHFRILFEKHGDTYSIPYQKRGPELFTVTLMTLHLLFQCLVLLLNALRRKPLLVQ